MVNIVRVKLKHLLIVFFLAVCAFSILFWPSQSPRLHYWQDKLFSPGAISIAHKWDQEGNKIICRDCHSPGKAITNGICRECHNRQYFERNQPVLADSHRIFDRQDYCLRCHGEHDGSYMALKIPMTPQVHKQEMTVDTEKCLDCHREKGRQTHPSLVVDKQDCDECHQNYEWKSDFAHKEHLAKVPTSARLIKICRDCHDKDYHYTMVPNADKGCIYCHEYWSKRKNRPIPFPENLFADVELNPGNFMLN